MKSTYAIRAEKEGALKKILEFMDKQTAKGEFQEVHPSFNTGSALIHKRTYHFSGLTIVVFGRNSVYNGNNPQIVDQIEVYSDNNFKKDIPLPITILSREFPEIKFEELR